MPSNPFQLENPGFVKLYVFGAGGSGREVAWLAEQSWGDEVAIEFVVDDPKYLASNINGHSVVLFTEITCHESARFVIAIGNPRDRRRISELFRTVPLQGISIVHPRAEMPGSVDIGTGTIICAGSIVTTNTRIGNHVHINIGCTLSHDVIVEDFATLSPGVHVSGHVHIGEGAFIGTGASIINGSAGAALTIGRDAIVAAGACVTTSVADGSTVAGVPAATKR